MPEVPVSYLADGGQDSASPSARILESQYARGVNIALESRIPSVRPPIRVIPITGDALAFFETLNFQGAAQYRPAAGQGATAYGRDDTLLVAAAGGRKFTFSFSGTSENGTVGIEEITNGVVNSPDELVFAWLTAENYAIGCDGRGLTFIWDGESPAHSSTGYNVTNKEASQIPNAASFFIYAHGRVGAAVSGRALVFGDMLNIRDQSSAKDILAFREQSYWATQTYFAPPSGLGMLNAAAVLPTQDTTHGQSDTVMHCDGGLFTVDLNVFPRSKWSESPLVKTAYIGTGAAGPYAVAVMNGADQIFRSTAGVQTFRSARAEAQMPGSPMTPISEPVASFLVADNPRMLRFASVETWPSIKRAFVTCYPMQFGYHRFHRGFVVLNFDPVPVRDSAPAWEGLWTLPDEVKHVLQFVRAIVAGEDRLFAFCRGGDGKTRIVEFRPEERYDILSSGTRQRIRAQLQTRGIDLQTPLGKKVFERATLILENCVGLVDWRVSYRIDGGEWTDFARGAVKNCEQDPDALDGEPMPISPVIPLGSIESKCNGSIGRQIQFLIRVAGRCSIGGISVKVDGKDPEEGTFDPRKLTIEACNKTVVRYEDYEYSDRTEQESWLTK